ncbi:MAG TPA: outer membrane beta-barrel protein [Bacteroidales bacterium]|nr:outer membrane beta-barrel protein [Bacteroidales bacterium]
MIKRLITLVLLCLPATLIAQETKWSLYPTLGMDLGGAVPFPLSDIPHGSKGTPRLSPNIGIGTGFQLSDKWAIEAEVSYHILSFSASADVRSQPFYSDDHTTTLYFSGHTKTDVELRFVQFPITAVYTINSTWTLTSGFYYSSILEGSFNTKGTKGVTSDDKSITDNASLPGIATATYSFDDNLDKWDAGLLLGCHYRLSPKVAIRTRMHFGFKSIFKKDFTNIDYEMYQVRADVGVTINLIGKNH